MNKTLYRILILFGLYSCAQRSKVNSLIDITSKVDKSSGFIDLTLSIIDKKETDSAFVYFGEGLYKSDTVGIQVSLKKGLKAGIVNGEMKNVFVSNGITFHSIGPKSDRLLSSMAELYGIDSIDNKMRNDLFVFTCANLNQEDLDYNSGEYKFKVFMETGEDNSELFIDFDFTNNLILLNEKDIEYRKGILKYLMKE